MLLIALLALALPGRARPDSLRPAGPAQVHDGRAGALAVTPPRIEAKPVIDGVLDEAAWAEADRLVGFSQYSPSDGVPASDSTQVLVWYSPTAVYFGIRAFESHGPAHATLADRDRIFADDYVELMLGTFNDGRQAMMFAVNPLGVQADGMLVERGNGSGGGEREPVDLSQDFVFNSKGHVTDWGYEVEIEIPLKSLRYQSADQQTWGLHVLRTVQHSGFEDTWVPARRSSASFLAQSGQLQGLTGFRRGLVMDITPEVTGRADGSEQQDGSWGYNGDGPNFGGTVRWGVTNSLSLNATANPDFSQIESDASQIVFDPRAANFVPEKRPFFLDGLEQFSTPNQLIYTRRVVQPWGALKFTGTSGGTNIGMLAAVDKQVGSLTGSNPSTLAIRLQQNVGTLSRVGVAATDREDGDDYNRVAAIDTRLGFAKIYNLTFQGGGSVTRTAGEAVTGPVWQGRFVRNGHTFGMNYLLNGMSEQFQAQTGFVSRPGIAHLALDHRLSAYGKQGGGLERLDTDILLDGIWNYHDFVSGNSSLERKLHIETQAGLRGGWGVGAGVFIETFEYDPQLLQGAHIERHLAGGVVDTVPFDPVPAIDNLDWFVRFNTPELKHLSANAFILWGSDDDFFQWQPTDFFFIEAHTQIRPTDQLRLSLDYQQVQYKRPLDGSLVGRFRIPRAKLEYQVARPIFVRLVGEYVASEVDSLRDDRHGGAAILLPDGNGTLTKQAPYVNNSFRVDALLSVQPNPGTVFFLGYGRLMDDPESFRFNNLSRQSDGFFLKMSYLFRIGS